MSNDDRQPTPESFAARHDGLFTTDAAMSGGLSEDQLARRRMSGRYVKLRRKVMGVAGAPPTWRQAVRGVVLSAGPGVAASNETAARLLGAPIAEVESIHVIARLQRLVRLDGVVAHRSGTIEPGDVVRRGGIPCTSPLRTIIDLSGSLDVPPLGKLVDHFLRARSLDLDALRSRVNRTRPAPGRSVRRLRAVLAQRIPGYDPGESDLEARIARVIDAARLPRPTQQHRISLDDRRYRIDFAWPDRKLYLEGNGFGFHSLSSDLDGDARRQNALVLAGWAPIEITWRMTDAEIEATLRRFLRAFVQKHADSA